MNRWSIYIDIEGFSKAYQEDGATPIRALGAIVEGIYLIGNKIFPASPSRLFAHQIGDGFVIVSEFGSRDVVIPISIAVILLRRALCAGQPARAAVSEGELADVSGCYPACIKQHRGEHGVIPLGEGLMTIFPVMGTALINANKVASKSRKGSLLIIDGILRDRLGYGCKAKRLES